MTTQVVVVADDFTGGNAAAAGFRRIGMRAATVSLTRLDEAGACLREDFDVVVVITDSRHADGREVARRVCHTLEAIGSVSLVCNRIDTTLRGSIGNSTAAILRHTRHAAAKRAVALCVPAHPAAARQTVGGVQLLNGVRLEETEAAHDPLNPISSSEVAAAFQSGTDLSVANVNLDLVTSGIDQLTAALWDGAQSCEVIVVDAITDEHLDRIARAAAPLGTEVTWVSVDPGPFSAALARQLGLDRDSAAARPPRLMVSGSATRLTMQQLRKVASERSVMTVRPYFVGGSPGRLDKARTTQALEVALHEAFSGDVVLLATALEDEHVITIDRETASSMAADLAAIVHAAISTRAVGGLYTTGGDVTIAVLQELDAQALEVEGEVLPLAVAGRLVGGSLAGLPVVTKGGLAGGVDAALLCIDHLELMKILSR